LDLQLHL